MAKRRHRDLELVVERETAQLAAVVEWLGRRLESSLASVNEKSVPDLDWVRAFRAYQLAVASIVAQQGDDETPVAGAERDLTPEEQSEAEEQIFSERVARMSQEQLSSLLLSKMRSERGNET